MITILDHLSGPVLPDPASTGSVRDPAEVLAGFRQDFHQALSRRAGALYDALAAGCVVRRLRAAVAAVTAAQLRAVVAG